MCSAAVVLRVWRACTIRGGHGRAARRAAAAALRLLVLTANLRCWPWAFTAHASPPHCAAPAPHHAAQRRLLRAGAREAPRSSPSCDRPRSAARRAVRDVFMGERGCPRWKRFLEERDWGAVSHFYSAALFSDRGEDAGPGYAFPVSIGSNLSYWAGQAGGADEGGAERWSEERASHSSHWRAERATYVAEIAYFGHRFSGLQRAPGQRTIVGACAPLPWFQEHVRAHGKLLQASDCFDAAPCALLAGCIEETLGPLMRLEREATGNRDQAAKAKGIPGLAVSGRTDAGVSAYGQVMDAVCAEGSVWHEGSVWRSRRSGTRWVCPLVCASVHSKIPVPHAASPFTPESSCLPRTQPPIHLFTAQVMSWHTWRRDVDVKQMAAAIDRAAPGEIRALRVSSASEAGRKRVTRCMRHGVRVKEIPSRPLLSLSHFPFPFPVLSPPAHMACYRVQTIHALALRHASRRSQSISQPRALQVFGFGRDVRWKRSGHCWCGLRCGCCAGARGTTSVPCQLCLVMAPLPVPLSP